MEAMEALRVRLALRLAGFDNPPAVTVTVLRLIMNENRDSKSGGSRWDVDV